MRATSHRPPASPRSTRMAATAASARRRYSRCVGGRWNARRKSPFFATRVLLRELCHMMTRPPKSQQSPRRACETSSALNSRVVVRTSGRRYWAGERRPGGTGLAGSHASLTLRNWLIGFHIEEYERHGEELHHGRTQGAHP